MACVSLAWQLTVNPLPADTYNQDSVTATVDLSPVSSTCKHRTHVRILTPLLFPAGPAQRSHGNAAGSDAGDGGRGWMLPRQADWALCCPGVWATASGGSGSHGSQAMRSDGHPVGPPNSIGGARGRLSLVELGRVSGRRQERSGGCGDEQACNVRRRKVQAGGRGGCSGATLPTGRGGSPQRILKCLSCREGWDLSGSRRKGRHWADLVGVGLCLHTVGQLESWIGGHCSPSPSERRV